MEIDKNTELVAESKRSIKEALTQLLNLIPSEAGKSQATALVLSIGGHISNLTIINPSAFSEVAEIINPLEKRPTKTE